jgi:hypothetical protein
MEFLANDLCYAFSKHTKKALIPERKAFFVKFSSDYDNISSVC